MYLCNLFNLATCFLFSSFFTTSYSSIQLSVFRLQYLTQSRIAEQYQDVFKHTQVHWTYYIIAFRHSDMLFNSPLRDSCDLFFFLHLYRILSFHSITWSGSHNKQKIKNKIFYNWILIGYTLHMFIHSGDGACIRSGNVIVVVIDIFYPISIERTSDEQNLHKFFGESIHTLITRREQCVRNDSFWLFSCKLFLLVRLGRVRVYKNHKKTCTEIRTWK